MEPPAGRRMGRKVLVFFCCLFLLAWFGWLALNMSGKTGLNRYEREWEAKGEHFNLADLVPKPVPADRNFALAPVVVTSYGWVLTTNGHRIEPQRTNYLNRLEMEIYGDESLLKYPTNSGNWAKGTMTDLKVLQLYYRALAAKTNEFPVAAQAQSPAADVLMALSKYDATIEELRQAAALPDSRFPLNYDSEPPANILLPHLAGLKRCSQVLELRAVAELQNGQSDKALADVKLTLRLAEAVRNEPFLISHLVRIAMVNLALQPVWEGIREHRWSDVQLAELSGDLAKLDFLADYEFAMRGERALAMGDIEYLRRTRSVDFLNNPDDGGDTAPEVTKIAFHLVPSSVFYQNELAIARAHQEWLFPIVDAARHNISPEAMRLATTNIEQQFSHWSPNNIFARLFLPALPRSSQKFAYAQNSVDMARVACALERFRLAQGEYPETLDVLSSKFIESLPPDVIGGKPLKYSRTDHGQFDLYSVGWNGVDDGGMVFFRYRGQNYIDYDRGDWVWSGQVMGGE